MRSDPRRRKRTESQEPRPLPPRTRTVIDLAASAPPTHCATQVARSDCRFGPRQVRPRAAQTTRQPVVEASAEPAICTYVRGASTRRSWLLVGGDQVASACVGEEFRGSLFECPEPMLFGSLATLLGERLGVVSVGRLGSLEEQAGQAEPGLGG